jgi:hypothetical protein
MNCLPLPARRSNMQGGCPYRSPRLHTIGWGRDTDRRCAAATPGGLLEGQRWQQQQQQRWEPWQVLGVMGCSLLQPPLLQSRASQTHTPPCSPWPEPSLTRQWKLHSSWGLIPGEGTRWCEGRPCCRMAPAKRCGCACLPRMKRRRRRALQVRHGTHGGRWQLAACQLKEVGSCKLS